MPFSIFDLAPIVVGGKRRSRSETHSTSRTTPSALGLPMLLAREHNSTTGIASAAIAEDPCSRDPHSR
jgi:hypothetical protein